MTRLPNFFFWRNIYMAINADACKIKYNGQNANDELEFVVYPPIISGANSLPYSFTATISMNDVKNIVRLAMMED